MRGKQVASELGHKDLRSTGCRNLATCARCQREEAANRQVPGLEQSGLDGEGHNRLAWFLVAPGARRGRGADSMPPAHMAC